MHKNYAKVGATTNYIVLFHMYCCELLFTVLTNICHIIVSLSRVL